MGLGKFLKKTGKLAKKVTYKATKKIFPEVRVVRQVIKELLKATHTSSDKALYPVSETFEEPRLHLIEPMIDRDEALIFINGYLSENKIRPEDNSLLWKAIRDAGWRGSLYHLWWDASNRTSFAMSASQLGAGVVLHWEAHKEKAKVVGLQYSYKMLSTLPEKKITIIGFSLGARIAYYTMQAWPNHDRRLKDIILLGGAVRRGKSKNWGEHVEKLSGKLVNVYNEKDSVLSYLFKTTALNRSPCGIKPLKELHSKIDNLNATELIGSSKHSCKSYLPHLELIFTMTDLESTLI